MKFKVVERKSNGRDSSAADNLRVECLWSLLEKQKFEEKIEFETRYFNWLVQSGLNTGIQNLPNKWLTHPFQEKRILININKQRFLLFLESPPAGKRPVGHPDDWVNVENNIVPNLFLRVQGLEKFHPKDLDNLKVNIEIKHLLFEKNCEFCTKKFYSFTQAKKYCCDECKDNAFNTRRRMKSELRKKEQKNANVIVSIICPICHEKYYGKARTCGNERCRKAEQRKRKTTFVEILNNQIR